MAVTDLTGTKWRFKEQGVVPFTEEAVNTRFYISGTCAGFNIANLGAPYVQGGIIMISVGINLVGSGSVDYIRTSDYVYSSLGLSTGEGWYRVDESAVKISAPTIEITGGTDATNTDLIAWLEANAEQIIEPTGNEYTLTQNLTNLTSGNITLTITADEGYALPAQADIVVTGGSIVSYDDTTGELVVTAGTTAVEITCESATPSGYTEMTLSNGETLTTSDGEEFLVKESEE